MQKLPLLKPGDWVDLIAPASRCSDKHLMDTKALLNSWGLNCIIEDTIFGEDLLCANSDERRFTALKNALSNSKSKAIICVRGGYGSMRLIPSLHKMPPPTLPKLFIGMSDITALHLYFQEQWQWPTLHAALAVDKFSPDSLACLKAIIFGESESLHFKTLPLNTPAKESRRLTSSIIGGNLSLIQASIGTMWQINAREKIIFLEEIGERGYRIDRMFMHLAQAKVFNEVAALILGDFIGGQEPDGSSLIQPVLQRFAQSCNFPVLQITGIGHGFNNSPLALGTKTQLYLGTESKLVCFR